MRNIRTLILLSVSLCAYGIEIPDPNLFDGSIQKNGSGNLSDSVNSPSTTDAQQSANSVKAGIQNKNESANQTSNRSLGSGVANSKDFKVKASGHSDSTSKSNVPLDEKFKVESKPASKDPASQKIFIPPGYPIQKNPQSITNGSTYGISNNAPSEMRKSGMESWGYKASPETSQSAGESGGSVPQGL